MSPVPLEAVVVHSARARPNTLDLTARDIIASPFGPPGFVWAPGSEATREYDPDHPHRTARDAPNARLLPFYIGTVGASDSLAPLVIPVVVPEVAPDPPDWVAHRGQDCRAHDRRAGRDVYGHKSYWRTSDLLVTNGMIRFWVGPRNSIPYLHVQALAGGTWHEEGCIAVGAWTDTITRVWLQEITHESVTARLELSSGASVLVELRRAERMLRFDGDGVVPAVRRVQWLGFPPPIDSYGLAPGPGRFGSGLALAAPALACWQWPGNRDAWAISGCWLPDDAVTGQDPCGIAGLLTLTELASFFEFTDAKTLRWTQGSQVLETAAIVFDAADPVYFALSYSARTGRVLTVKVGAGAPLHIVNAAFTDPGTAQANYSSFFVAPMSGPELGYSDTYSDIYESAAVGTYSVDELMVFEDALSVLEADALANATNALEGLPSPEGRLLWYAPFDTNLYPAPSTLVGGRTHEVTTPGGSTRVVDAGFTKAIALLSGTPAVEGPGLGVATVGTDLEAAAILATGAVGDDLADHHVEFAADWTNELFVRSPRLSEEDVMAVPVYVEIPPDGNRLSCGLPPGGGRGDAKFGEIYVSFHCGPGSDMRQPEFGKQDDSVTYGQADGTLSAVLGTDITVAGPGRDPVYRVTDYDSMDLENHGAWTIGVLIEVGPPVPS